MSLPAREAEPIDILLLVLYEFNLSKSPSPGISEEGTGPMWSK
jgi:hypothetical protein